MPFVETPTGLRMYYEEMGSGRPVVFVHGWAMSGRVWRFQQELAERYRLIFLDLRGHGHSDTASGYSLQDYAGDIPVLLDRLELRDAVLVAWSMGVQVVLLAFPAIRSRVAALVLIGGTPRFTSAEHYPHGQAPNQVKGMGLRLRRDHQKTMGEFFRGMFVEGEMGSEQYQRIVHEIVMGGRSADHDAVMTSLQILSEADIRDELPLVDCPVLLVHGAGDTICPASASQYMAQVLPHATLNIMEGCGHAPFMTQPEKFNGLLAEYISGLRD